MRRSSMFHVPAMIAVMIGAALALGPAHADEPADHAHEATAADHSHGADASHVHEEHAGGHGHHTIHGQAPKNYFGAKTEFLHWSPQLFIWTLLLFLPLWFLLHRLVWGPMIRAIEDRDHRIAESLITARRLREEAKSISAEQDADTIRAQQEARSVIDQARADAAKDVATLMADAREEATQQQRAAREAIETAASQGRAEIERGAEALGAKIAETLSATGGRS